MTQQSNSSTFLIFRQSRKFNYLKYMLLPRKHDCVPALKGCLASQ